MQQTRVVQGLPYYNKFVEHFKKIEELAEADEQEVLRLWQGLGYYSRARNLHKCAKIVAKNFDGNFPFGYKNLIKLPGIGKYTAAAIASFAFGEKVAAVDGNVYRVLSRVYGIDADISTGKGQKVFEEWANDIIPDQQPDTFNQALMEFGAMQCTPKSPSCGDCVFRVECYARSNNMQGDLPVKSTRVKVQNRYFHYLVFKDGQKLAMKKRSGQDIWKGLYDFHLFESDESQDMDVLIEVDSLLKNVKDFISDVEISADYKHILTHRIINARFFTFFLKPGYDKALDKLMKEYELQFFSEKDIAELPKPVLVSRYLNGTIF